MKTCNIFVALNQLNFVLLHSWPTGKKLGHEFFTIN